MHARSKTGARVRSPGGHRADRKRFIVSGNEKLAAFPSTIVNRGAGRWPVSRVQSNDGRKTHFSHGSHGLRGRATGAAPA